MRMLWHRRELLLQLASLLSLVLVLKDATLAEPPDFDLRHAAGVVACVPLTGVTAHHNIPSGSLASRPRAFWYRV